jgi:hypothetical protein
MPQVQMPVFPAGTTKITAELAFEKRAGKVVYFNGHLPVFMHAEEDLGAFRLTELKAGLQTYHERPRSR